MVKVHGCLIPFCVKSVRALVIGLGLVRNLILLISTGFKFRSEQNILHFCYSANQIQSSASSD